MNILDLLVCVVLALAVWNGWRQGCIVQLCSLAGLIVSVWLAARFGPEAGRFCGLDESIAAPAGFAIVLLAALCVAALIGRSIRKLLHFAGLGFADVLLGIAVAVVKYVFLLGCFYGVRPVECQFQAGRTADARTVETLSSDSAGRRMGFPVVERIQEQASERLPAFREADEADPADAHPRNETI